MDPQASHSISTLIHDCVDFFDECNRAALDIPREKRLQLAAQQRYLRLWAKTFQVFVNGDACLDRQLDASFDHLRALIVANLENILNNLLAIARLIPDEHITTRAALQACNIVEDYNVFINQIENSMLKLRQVASILLYPTEKGLGRRVASFRRMFDDTQLNVLMRTIIRDQYPQLLRMRRIMSRDVWRKAGFGISKPATSYYPTAPNVGNEKPMGLFKALIDVVLFRHYHILYEREVRARGTDPTIPRGVPMLSLSARDPQPSAPKDAQDAVHSPEKVPSSSEVTTAETLEYPRPPTFGLDETKAKCPICHQMLCIDTFKGDKWISHLYQDIQPYVCLDERCLGGGNPPFFTTREMWRDHMRTSHHMQWLDYVQESLLWTCPVCRYESPTVFASNELAEEDLKRHMRDFHSPEEMEYYLCAVELSISTYFNPNHTCLICKACYPEEAGAVPSREGMQRTSVRGKESGQGHEAHPHQYSSTEVCQKSLDTVARRRAEDCVAGHLRFLAFFFAKYLVNQDADCAPSSAPSSESRGSSMPLTSQRQLDLSSSYHSNSQNSHSNYSNGYRPNSMLGNRPFGPRKIWDTIGRVEKRASPRSAPRS